MTNFTWFRCYFQHKYIDFVVIVYGSVLFRYLVCVIHLIRRILHIKDEVAMKLMYPVNFLYSLINRCTEVWISYISVENNTDK